MVFVGKSGGAAHASNVDTSVAGDGNPDTVVHWTFEKRAVSHSVVQRIVHIFGADRQQSVHWYDDMNMCLGADPKLALSTVAIDSIRTELTRRAGVELCHACRFPQSQAHPARPVA